MCAIVLSRPECETKRFAEYVQINSNLACSAPFKDTYICEEMPVDKIFALGRHLPVPLNNKVVGLVRFCVFPSTFESQQLSSGFSSFTALRWIRLECGSRCYSDVIQITAWPIARQKPSSEPPIILAMVFSLL